MVSGPEVEELLDVSLGRDIDSFVSDVDLVFGILSGRRRLLVQKLVQLVVVMESTATPGLYLA